MPGIYSAHDAIIGVQGALGGRGGGLRYLLRDEFTTDRAAGAVNGTLAEPGPGTRTVLGTHGTILIESGLLKITGANTSYSDPVVSFGGLTRTAGRVIIAKVTYTNSTGPHWGITPVGTPSLLFGQGVVASAGNQLFVFGNVQTTSPGTQIVAIVLRATGAYGFWYTGSRWRLVSILSSGSTADLLLLANMYSSTATGMFDYIRVPTAKWLPTPLLSDGFGSAFGTSDGLGHAEGVAGGIGAGGSGVTLSNAGGTWSVSGGKAINTPSVGADVVTNGNMETGDPPTGWASAFAAVLDGVADERTGGAGAQSLSIARNGSDYSAARNSVSTTIGQWYRVQGWLKKIDASNVHIYVSDLSNIAWCTTGTQTSTAWTQIAATGRCTSASSYVTPRAYSTGADGTSGRFDDIALVPLTLSELLSLSNLSCADVYAGVAITKSNTYVQAGLALNWDSASSPANGLIVYLSGGNIVVDKCVAGTWTSVSATAYTYSAGARLVATMNAGALRVYYNGALITKATIVDAGILTGTMSGLFSTDASSTFDDLTAYAIGTGGEYSQLDSY